MTRASLQEAQLVGGILRPTGSQQCGMQPSDGMPQLGPKVRLCRCQEGLAAIRRVAACRQADLATLWSMQQQGHAAVGSESAFVLDARRALRLFFEMQPAVSEARVTRC